MNYFTQLYIALDETKSIRKKQAAIVYYLNNVAADDAAWGVYFLLGNRIGKTVRGKILRQWVNRLTGYPEWLVDASYAQVGDLAETIALLLNNLKVESKRTLPSLHELVKVLQNGLNDAHESSAFEVLKSLWQAGDCHDRLLLNKFLTGGLRVGVSRGTVIKALAEVAQLGVPVMAHRMMRKFQPTAEYYKKLISSESNEDELLRPYPFYLCYPLERDLNKKGQLGPIEQWQIEWKWDGIRAQLIRRKNEVLLWSRDEELIGEAFPEIVEAAKELPVDTVLDGELIGWDSEKQKPLSFVYLQRRVGRKKVDKLLFKTIPVRFVSYDLLESEGIDRREETTVLRRQRLERILLGMADKTEIFISPLIEMENWELLESLLKETFHRRVEGFMVKRKTGIYRGGRARGDWWKWKIEPLTLDAVLINSVQGHGRRSGLYTDHTFALRDGVNGWVPFTKAYSGLKDEEMRRIDAWIRRHTVAKHGPVRIVEPKMVFEIAFEGVAESRRHKCGLAVRFPRIHRWRTDKTVDQADDLSALKNLHRSFFC
jgi:DNA ligase-1